MYIEHIDVSIKINLLKKQIAELQARLEVEMSKNANVSDGTLPLDIVERTTSKRKVIMEPKSIRVIKETKSNRQHKDVN